MRLGGILLLAGLLAGCGTNPLLTLAVGNPVPVQVGSTWTYHAPAPSTNTAAVSVTAFGVQHGRSAYTLQTVVDSGAPADLYLNEAAGVWDQFDPSNPGWGWTTWRKTPYVPGSNWAMAAPAQISLTATVMNLQSVTVPAGKFPNCFQISIERDDFTGPSEQTTFNLIWTVPNVGDVQYATVDAGGTQTITYQLVSYFIP